MMDFLRTYQSRPWPKLEIPALKRSQLIALVVYVLLLVAASWVIWGQPLVHAEYFLFLGAGIPLLYLLKSPFVTIVGLLTFQVLAAFLFMGNQAYVIGAVLGLMGAIVAFESPIFMYLALVFAVWLGTSSFGTGISLRMEFIVGAGLLVGWLFRDFLNPRAQTVRSSFPEIWPALLFLLWVVVGFIFWCPEPFPLGWASLKYILAGVLFFLVSPLVVTNEKHLNYVLLAWIVVGLFAAVSSIFFPQTMTTEDVTSTWGYAPGALGMQKNWAASFMTFSFFAILSCFYWVRGGGIKFLLVIGSLMMATAIFYQQSKSGAAGLVFGFIVFWLADTYFITRKRNLLLFLMRILVLLIAIALLVIAIYFVGLEHYIGAYADIFFAPTTSPTMTIRQDLWDTAFTMISKEHHAFRGLGVAAFWLLGGYYGLSYEGHTEPEYLMMQGMNPHSLYIDTFLHYGVPGSLFFLWLSFSLLARLWRGFLHCRVTKWRYILLGFFCALMAFYFHGFLDFTVFIISRFWLFAGTCIAVIHLAKLQEQTESARSGPLV